LSEATDTISNPDAAEESAMHQKNEIEIVKLDHAEILFRRLDAPVASWSKPGIRWAVEYWWEEMAYPVAQAWVVMNYGPYVDWLHVMDGHRRLGIGTALLMAITERWPYVEFDAFTESGELFLASNEAWKDGADYGDDGMPPDDALART